MTGLGPYRPKKQETPDNSGVSFDFKAEVQVHPIGFEPITFGSVVVEKADFLNPLNMDRCWV